jgi:hypothetical protein
MRFASPTIGGTWRAMVRAADTPPARDPPGSGHAAAEHRELPDCQFDRKRAGRAEKAIESEAIAAGARP